MNLQIVAVADGPPKHDYLIRGYEAFVASCVRHGIAPTILGWDQPWTGLGCKPKLIKKAIEEGVVNADYIIFADAFDVVFARSPYTALQTFKDNWESQYRIMWNAERYCFPDESLAQFHPETPYPWKFLNSGLSIGKTQDYLQVLTEMKVDDIADDFQVNGIWSHSNDQLNVQHKFLFGQCAPHELKMGLDSECSMFQTMIGETMDTFEWQDGKLRNKITGQFPSALHFNGNSKTAGLMEPILKELGL